MIFLLFQPRIRALRRAYARGQRAVSRYLSTIYRDNVKTISRSFQASVQNLTVVNEKAITDISDSHKDIIAEINRSHIESVKEMLAAHNRSQKARQRQHQKEIQRMQVNVIAKERAVSKREAKVREREDYLNRMLGEAGKFLGHASFVMEKASSRQRDLLQDFAKGSTDSLLVEGLQKSLADMHARISAEGRFTG